MLDEKLKAAPGDLTLLAAKADALMGLHRYWDAGQVCTPFISSRPEFRYRAGLCLMALGRVNDGVQVLSPLRGDPRLAEDAYVRLVWALRAVGQEKDARELLDEGLAKVPPPPLKLLRLSLELDPLPEQARAAADQLDASDPRGAREYETYCRLLAAAGEVKLSQVHANALPAEVLLGQVSTSGDPARPVSSSPKVARGPAPSAIAWGGLDSYDMMPAGIKYYAAAQDPETKSTGMRTVIPVSLGGPRQEAMILDSECQRVLLTTDLAKKLDLQSLGVVSTKMLGQTESELLDAVLLKSLKVGPLEFHNVPAAVVRPRAGLWPDIAGVVPLGLFDGFALHIDRRSGKLTFYPSGTKPEPVLGPGSFRAKALWSEGKPFVQTSIQGQPACFLLLDLSSNFTYLDPGRLGGLGLDQVTARYGTQSESGLGGPITSGVVADVKLSLGPSTITMPTVRVAALAPPAPLDCWGILGGDILKHFDVFVDYRAGVLAFRGY